MALLIFSRSYDQVFVGAVRDMATYPGSFTLHSESSVKPFILLSKWDRGGDGDHGKSDLGGTARGIG